MNKLTNHFHAVKCPETHDYFLINGDQVIERPLVSKISGNRISPDDLYIQYIPTDDVIYLEECEINSFLKIWNEHLPENSPLADLKNDWIPKLMSNIDAEVNLVKKSFDPKDIPVEVPRPEVFSEDVAAAIFEGAVEMEVAQYKNNYLTTHSALHEVTLDRLGQNIVVFNVGQGGSAMFALPLATISTEDVVKMGVCAALLAEIISLLARLLGVKPNLNKARKAIQKKLQDSRVIKAIQRFLHRLGEAGESATKSVLELIKDLWQLGALQALVWPALAGAFGFWALVWALGKMMAKIAVPAIGFVMIAAEIAIVMAGLAAKIAKLLEAPEPSTP